MTEQQWLIDETAFPDSSYLKEIEEEFSQENTRSPRESTTQPQPLNLAVRLQDIMIWDTKKWFGDARMRLDALVVHGKATEDDSSSFYMPQTFRFDGIKDNDRLPTGENGLLIFYGEAVHFLDIFITVSRDRKDSDDLATLLNQQMQSPEIQGAVSTMIGFTAIATQAATFATALGAASALGNFAYKALSKATGDTIGVYRTSWLQYRDKFGIGRHPQNGSHKVRDISFWYEIIQEGNG
ncbi:hypothetical protein Riv7116_2978 [Rivularia sp. PCC 7116]|uniref:hypothetical protein n=1 Tax=Rivularia sp. PCC 7116 TaxID=373994 RepID=UPI00029F18A1|nr:hypothetical protein [Rivularia sp. PCC 7116]AFY55459.1 hypothetical protein Riv7116_2978 [Rivularia sp. PCC 7116]